MMAFGQRNEEDTDGDQILRSAAVDERESLAHVPLLVIGAVRVGHGRVRQERRYRAARGREADGFLARQHARRAGSGTFPPKNARRSPNGSGPRAG